MIIGAIVSTASYMIFTPSDEWTAKGFLGAAAGGAVSGAVVYFAKPWGELGLGQAMAWGAAAGASGQAASLIVQGEDITTQKNISKIVTAGAIGAVAGGVANGLMSKVRAGTSDSEFIKVGDEVIDWGVSGAEGGAQEVGGKAIDFADEIILNIRPY